MVVLPSLYEHQERMRDDTRAALAKYRRAIVCAPPGTGKTRLSKWIMGAYANRPKREDESGRAAFMVHRRGLVNNASNSFGESPELRHGLIMAGCDTSPGLELQVASIDSILSWYCEGGEYSTDYTYDLVVFDECVAGDSVIETELGRMRIDEVPARRPHTVKTHSDELGVHFANILNWKHSGYRDTIELHTHMGKIQCTPDHEILTRRGWLQAQYISLTDEIFACADAESSREVGSCFGGGIESMRHQGNLESSGTSSTPTVRPAPVDVALKHASPTSTMMHGSGLDVSRNSANTRRGTRSTRAIRTWSSRNSNDKRFSGRCSATLPSVSQISDLPPRDWRARTATTRRNGRITKQHTCIASTQRPVLPRTPGGESGLCAQRLHAIQHFGRSSSSLRTRKRSVSRDNGLNRSATSVLRGGYATTVPQRPRAFFYTRRDFPRLRMRSLRSGFATTSARPLFATTGRRTHASSALPVGPKSSSASESLSMSPTACDTSWCRVTGIVAGKQVDVYDIEVEKSHCFFANNLMVHNCHSHLSKLRTFLEAHDAKRAELGLKPAFVLGLSATPQHKELSKVFNHIVNGPSPKWLIENGYLSPFRYFQCTKGQLDQLVKNGDEYTESSVAAAMDGLAGDLVNDWKRLAEGRATVGFFPRRSHAQEAMELLRDSGIDAHYVDGETPDDEREQLFKWLNSGDIEYICNVGVIERGTDIPRIGCVQMCTAVGNVVRWRQMIGRGSRIHPAKSDCIILDHADGIRRHGFFDDDIEWTLEWGERPSKEHAPRATVECPSCSAVYRGGKCMHCGYEPTARERKAQGLEFVGGELQEVSRKERKEPKKKTCEELMIMGLYVAGKRGGTWGQAWHVAKSAADKQGTKFRVPATVEVAGKRYKTIPYGHPDAKLRVRDTYGFTVGKYDSDDNPYRVREGQVLSAGE